EVVGQEQQRLRLGDPVLRDRAEDREPQGGQHAPGECARAATHAAYFPGRGPSDESGCTAMTRPWSSSCGTPYAARIAWIRGRFASTSSPTRSFNPRSPSRTPIAIGKSK